MNYREKIRKAIECPQFGNETYGEWGALNLEQRKYIKRLLDELDRADNYIKNVHLENKQLKDNWNKLKEWLNNEIKSNEEYDKFNNSEWQGYCFFYKFLDKVKELESGYSDE